MSIQFGPLTATHLAAHVERVCYNGITVGSQSNERSSSLTVNYRLQNAIHSSLTARVILNIREAASRRLDDFSFDLHLSDTTHVSRSRMSFAENPVALHSAKDSETDA